MPYSNEEGNKHFLSPTDGSMEHFGHTLYFSDPLNGGTVGFSQVASDADRHAAHDRCCALCTANNEANSWLKPSAASQDASGATLKQCRQFSVIEFATGTFACNFFDFHAGPLEVYEKTGPDLPVGPTWLYSTLPLINSANSPNNPPSPASPPPPFAGTTMPASECDALIDTKDASAMVTRVCKYYYTPMCVGTAAECGSEPAALYCSDGVSQVPSGDLLQQTQCMRSKFVGYVKQGESRPAYIHHVASSDDCSHYSVQTYLDEMVNRSFAAFCVAYPRSTEDQYVEGFFDQKAQWIYSSSNQYGALTGICNLEGVDCSLGVAVHGSEQGGHIASLSKKHDPRVTAILEFGGGCSAQLSGTPLQTARGLVYDHTQAQTLSGAACYSGGSATATQTEQQLYRTKDILRVVAGVNDDLFSHQSQMIYHTGYNCGDAVDCLQADGSGYYLVRSPENPTGERDGREFYSNLNAFTTNFEYGAYAWAMTANLDWLAGKATGQSYTASSPPPSPPPPSTDLALEG
jgi:hypothetical protein